MTDLKNLTDSYQDLDIYRPPIDEQQDIVDVVCRIVEEDGPRPMRNLRPAKKQRNAAEQFYADHDDVYEARGKSSRDRLEAVHLHNSGYPKMHDELKKKRSTTKITAVSEHPVVTLKQATHKRQNTGIKNKIKMDSPPKKNSKPRYHSRDTKGKARRRDNSRITKTKSRHTRSRLCSCKTYKLMKIKANIGCQCSSYYIAKDKKNGTDNIILPPGIVDKMAVEEDSFRCYHLNQNLADVKRQRTCNDTSSKGSKQNNPDSDGSVSTYNSYASLEHEPMIS